jgi:hypothetical protein
MALTCSYVAHQQNNYKVILSLPLCWCLETELSSLLDSRSHAPSSLQPEDSHMRWWLYGTAHLRSYWEPGPTRYPSTCGRWGPSSPRWWPSAPCFPQTPRLTRFSKSSGSWAPPLRTRGQGTLPFLTGTMHFPCGTSHHWCRMSCEVSVPMAWTSFRDCLSWTLVRGCRLARHCSTLTWPAYRYSQWDDSYSRLKSWNHTCCVESVAFNFQYIPRKTTILTHCFILYDLSIFTFIVQ